MRLLSSSTIRRRLPNIPSSRTRLVTPATPAALTTPASLSTLARGLATLRPRPAGFAQFLKISDEVKSALNAGQPVVALESAIYTHGFPHPQNLELAQDIEAVIRAHGAVPATICMLNGKAVVGLSSKEMEQMTDSANYDGTRKMKVSRRDLAFALGSAMNDPSRALVGGTTIAGTSVIAHLAGIKVFATGGLGGVHRGVEKTMDISADLTELGRTPVAVVCAGSKAFLDLERTLEYLETEGVYVGTFGSDMYPAFYSREAGIKSPSVVKDAKEAASIIYASHALGLTSGQLFANPIPSEFEIPNSEIQSIIKSAVSAAEAAGASGKDNTPFILADILRRTEGRSIKANRGLILNNAKMGAQVAVELSKLEGESSPESIHARTEAIISGNQQPVRSSFQPPPITPPAAATISPVLTPPTPPAVPAAPAPKALVLGALAVDILCDPHSPPVPETSNPSTITESLGGVGNNVAYALHLSGIPTRLVAAIGNDSSGDWALKKLQERGMGVDGIKVVEGMGTPRYVAINDAKGGLFVSAADMAAVEEGLQEEEVRGEIGGGLAEWVVVDGNLSSDTIMAVMKEAARKGKKVIFEPTSTIKSTRLFPPGTTTPLVYPSTPLYASTPNLLELTTLYQSCLTQDLFSTSLPWWPVLDSFLITSEFRDSITTLSRRISLDLQSDGLITKAIQLLPYIPRLFIKLGEKGCLVVRILEDWEQKDEKDGRRGGFVIDGFRLRWNGLVEVRYFPAEKVNGDVVGVNGAGDTFLGVLVAGLVRGDGIADAVERAQRAAVLTLASKEAVSEKVKGLAW
ncbi:IdgA domain-containing protein [Pyronema omphalodes]|nr:IdgA domain-containing protein [Pyronema omphalodes]